MGANNVIFKNIFFRSPNCYYIYVKAQVMKFDDPLISSSEYHDVFSIHLRTDGIYKMLVNEGAEFKPHHLDLMVQSLKKLGGQKLPMIIVCGKDATTSTSLMQKVARENTNPYATCDAFVLQSFNQSMLANFYIKFVKPLKPTAFFTDTAKAMKWLEMQKTKAEQVHL